MPTYELYDWNDSCAYLTYMIVRTGNKYAILDNDLNWGFNPQRFKTMDEAKRAVDRFYLFDQVFDVLLRAADDGLITQQQREKLTDMVDNEFPKCDLSRSPERWVDARELADQVGTTDDYVRVLRKRGILKENLHWRPISFNGENCYHQYNLRTCTDLFLTQGKVALMRKDAERFHPQTLSKSLTK